MSVADKLHQRQMALRKKSGLPHPDYYKELGHSYSISDDRERLAKQAEIKKKYKVESVEQLDEMPESSMKTRDVHAHLKKSGWSLKRTSGGHDVYGHPKSKENISVPRHKQLKAPLIRGIMKASRVSEETEVNEQIQTGRISYELFKKGRHVSGPSKKPFQSFTQASPRVNEEHMKEAKDPREYDYEGDMAMSQLRSLMFNAQDLIDMMDDNTNLPEWVQSKITLAEDYISTAANYLRGELSEAANPAQQAAIAINMKKKGIKPKGMKEEVKRYVPSPHGTPVAKKPKGEYERKVDKYLKKKYNKEEVELTEGRPSQRHPLEGHEYHKKSNEALVHIAKDAHEAAEAMKSHNTTAENKYRDQANDSATVRHWRKKNGMPDWYKKKYGHVNEEIEYLEEKNAPTNPALWSKAKALAKQKFDVYPSAYANGWASKWYKSKGGGWKTVSEAVDEPSAAARTLSRKAQIVRDAAKGKKQEQEEASDKFQKDPELSSDMQKT